MKRIVVLIIGLIITFNISWQSSVHAADVWVISDCHKIDPATGKDFNPFVDKNIAKRNYLWDSLSNTVTIYGDSGYR